MKKPLFRRLRALAGVSLLLFVVISAFTPHSSVRQQLNPLGQFPFTAAAAGTRGVYPTPNAELNASTTYNITTSARDDGNLARTFDAADLAIEKEGMPYSTTAIPGMGRFPGTFSFANDASGGLAAGWTYGFSSSCSGQVVDSYLGHQKVLQLTDGNGAGNYGATQTFNNSQTTGTISLWFACTGVGVGPNVILLYDGSNNNLVNIYITGGNFVFYHPPSTTIAPYDPNRWYHWTIEFDTNTDTANVTLDGVRKLTNEPFTTNGGAVVRYTAASGTVETYTEYLDAIDYSWSPAYIANRSALDLSLLGFYNATSSFEEEAPFSVPAGWINSSAGTGVNSFTLPAVPTAATGHKNVLCLTDTSGTNLAAANYNFTAKTAGRVAFWTYLVTTTYCAWLTLDSTGGYLSAIDIQSGNLHAYTTGAGDITVMAVSANTWYYIELSFNAGVWDLYVNGLLKQSGLGYYSSSSNPATCFLARTGGGTTGTFYLDAVDFSWDPEYYTERSSYMHLQQSMTFTGGGSYSFRYTLTSTGTDYLAAWTPFTVVVPEEPAIPTHGIFFSASSMDLAGVPENTAFLYLDGALKSWGTVDLVNGTHNVTVKDYFGSVIFSETVSFVAGGNYGIALPMATLVVNNFHNTPKALEITKTGGSGTFRQLMGAQDSVTVRLASGSYHLFLYDLDGSQAGGYPQVTLAAGANEERNFGEAPPLFTMEWIILVGLISVCAVLIIVTIARTGRGWREGLR